jgi:hypothetical protein
LFFAQENKKDRYKNKCGGDDTLSLNKKCAIARNEYKFGLRTLSLPSYLK